MANPLATPEEVAEWLQIPVQRLKRWRKTPERGPKFIRVGRSIRYAWGDVHTWCATNRPKPTGGERGE